MPSGLPPRARATVVLTVVAGALLLAGTLGASAQVGLPIESTTTSSPSTTSAPPPEPGPAESTTTTTTSTTTTTTTSTTAPPALPDPTPGPGPGPGPAPGDPPPPGSPTTDEPPPPAGDDGTEPPTVGAGPFPSELQALMNSVVRTGSNNTRKLIEALAPLAEYGVTPEQAAMIGFGRFPIAGHATYSHDWWFPRFGPGWRLHQGTDIFAAHGTPVRAPVDGTVRITNGGLGGLAVYVIQPDRTYWYLAHLSAIAEGIAEGVTVKTGQIVGFVGDSGNARGGQPHVHFEVHPGGGPPIDPKPILDQFITDAVALAPKLIDAYAQASAGQAAAAPAEVEIPEPKAPDLSLALPPRATLLWASSFSPAAGALELAEAEAMRVASTIDWDRWAVDRRRAAERRMRDELAARAWLAPLVPPRLLALLPLPGE